jgi:hypothetical protein
LPTANLTLFIVTTLMSSQMLLRQK